MGDVSGRCVGEMCGGDVWGVQDIWHRQTL